MNPKFFFACLFILSSIRGLSQADFSVKRQKLKTLIIDTMHENFLVLDRPNTLLYFKQDDIIDFIDSAKKTKLFTHKSPLAELEDTLKFQVKKIVIINIYSTYTDVEKDSILKLQPINKNVQQIDQQLYFIAAGLILNGRCMIYAKASNKFVSRNLMAKRRKGIMGAEDLIFRLPSGKIFYNMVVALGD